MRYVALVLSFMVLTLNMAIGQEKPGSQDEAHAKSVADSRSFDELFGNLEDNIADALEQGDMPSLEKLLSPEFIFRSSAHAQGWISREKWMRANQVVSRKQSAASVNAKPNKIRTAMTIRTYGGGVCQAAAVVSYVTNSQEKTFSNQLAKAYLVVDVWETNTVKQWQLAQRYVSAANSDRR